MTIFDITESSREKTPVIKEIGFHPLKKSRTTYKINPTINETMNEVF